MDRVARIYRSRGDSLGIRNSLSPKTQPVDCTYVGSPICLGITALYRGAYADVTGTPAVTTRIRRLVGTRYMKFWKN